MKEDDHYKHYEQYKHYEHYEYYRGQTDYERYIGKGATYSLPNTKHSLPNMELYVILKGIC